MKAQFIYENINFERGNDPKEAMGIGKAGKASQIDWDWHPSWDNKLTGKEKFIDIFSFPNEFIPNLYIKVAKIWDLEGRTFYYAMNNIGEPYNGDPEYFDTPEEALADHKIYLKNYFEDY